MRQKYLLILAVVVFLSLYIYCVKRYIIDPYRYGICRDGKNLLYYISGDHVNLNKTTQSIFDSKNIKRCYDYKLADIYIPGSYDNAEEEYGFIPNNTKFIHTIKGCDNIVSKSSLWYHMKDYYSKESLNYVPKTYLLSSDEDIKDLLSVTEFNKIFILKKNIQRQEGITLLKRSEISSELLYSFRNEGYVVAQEYIDDPYIIDGRKINLRIYLLIVLEGGNKKAYMFDDGFIYYTKKSYKYSTNTDEGITTGYIDRQVYIDNPLTHNDLKRYLGKSDLFNNIKNLLRKVLEGINGAITMNKGSVNYQLFGVDIQPDSNLNVKLIEINKGPSLEEMDARDSEVKGRLQKDIYKTIGLYENNSENGLELIWSK